MSPDDSIERARELLAGAERVIVLTGAGVSAESGVPTFRGAGGLWKSFRAEELATPGAFARDPRLVWEWYQWRRDLVAECRPNAAHHALARWAAARDGVTIVTQNVDGLHAAAARALTGEPGLAAERARPLELHGSLAATRCSRCEWREEPGARVDASTVETLPRCPRCGAVARPAVVWFGEALDERVIAAALAAAGHADACLVIGTSGVVQPAAGLAEVTRRHGGAVIEVNPDPTPITAIADVALRGRAGEIVPPLVAP